MQFQVSGRKVEEQRPQFKFRSYAGTVELEKFAASPIGNLVETSGTDKRTGETYKHSAFVPDPLRSEPQLSNESWRAIGRANRALGRLQQGSRFVPNPGLLRQPTLRREAQSTSALEGTFAPLEDVLAADVIDTGSRSLALAEVLNFVEAAEVAFGTIEDGQRISLSLLRQVHAILVRGTAAETIDAGRVRSIQVAIGSRGGGIEDARFVPMPPGSQLEAGVHDLVDWISATTSPDERDPVVAAAMAHYQFETLHPFNDGNGRIGRLLIVIQLLQDGALASSLLSVSPWFEQRRERYQDELAEVSATSDWDSWVRFFAQGIEAAALDTAKRLERVLDVQDEYQRLLRDAGIRGIGRDIAAHVIGAPYVDLPTLARALGKTYQGVKDATLKLVALGILDEITVRHRKVYRARAVVEAYSL